MFTEFVKNHFPENRALLSDNHCDHFALKAWLQGEHMPWTSVLGKETLTETNDGEWCVLSPKHSYKKGGYIVRKLTEKKVC